MSLELWQNRILSTAGTPKRFTFFNPATNGLGAWVEFTDIADVQDTNVPGLRQINFKLENGSGQLWITDSAGAIRAPFFDRTWFYGTLQRKEKECMARFRFIDEPSGGTELGTRIYTHWRFGSWRSVPAQDVNGKLLAHDIRISFGWSVNGNAYYWELKPVETAAALDEAKKTPKTFVQGKAPVSGEQAEGVQESAPVKKPKMFVPKTALVSEQTVPAPEAVTEKKPKIFVPKSASANVQTVPAPESVTEKKPETDIPENKPDDIPPVS